MRLSANYSKHFLFFLALSFWGFSSLIQAQSLKITDIKPTNGAANSELTIYGNGFDASAADNTVTYTPGDGGTGQTASVTNGSVNHLNVTVPSGLSGGNYNIEVERASDGNTANTPVLFDIASSGGDFGDPATSQKVINSSADFIQSVFAADLDGDGDHDLATANAPFGGGSQISWYENNGGSFGSGNVISTAVDRSYSVHAADLDGDDNLDLISASETDDKIAWYKNNGNGSFGSQQVISANADDAKDVFAADLDQDGDVDLILGKRSEIVWYENDGASSPSFSEHSVSGSVSQLRSVIAVDIDGDNILDIASASSSDNKIAWYENTDGDGSFSSQNMIFWYANGVRDLYAADLDDDGDQDLISAVYDDNTVAWYENDGTGNFGNEFSGSTQKEISSNANGVWTVSAADLDANGDMDVIAGTNNGDKIVWYDNDGSASFGSGQDISTSAEGARSVAAADFNNDGSIDVASASAFDDKLAWYENIPADPVKITKIQPLNGSANTNIRIYGPEFSGSQSDFEVTFSPAGGSGETGTVEDSVGDGVIYAEVPSGLSGRNYEISAERVSDGSKTTFSGLFGVSASGSGNFSDRMEIDEFNTEDGDLHLADLDDDGNLDVFSENGWYSNDGDGNFGNAQSSSVDFNEIKENYADLDGDGLLDYAYYSNQEILWNENDGDGTYTTHVIEELDNNFAPPVITADINEDGYLDIVTYILIEKPSPPHTLGITVFKNNGSGGFNLNGVEDVYIIDADITDVRDLHAADFDDDGDTDIAVSSSEEGSEPDLAWFENGLTQSEGSGTGPIGETTSHNLLADVQNADTISFGAANQVADFDDEGSWSVTSADIDGDEQLDLIAIGHDDGEIAWFENTGGSGSNKFGDKQIITRKALGGLSVKTGDLDNDGDMDIVVSSDYTIGESDRADILGWYENTPEDPASPVEDGASRSVSDGAINIKQNDAYEDLTSFTLELWFKTTYSGNNQQGIIEHYTKSGPLSNKSNDTGWYLLQPFGSDKLSFRIETSETSSSELTPGYRELTTETSVEANKWYHVAVVYKFSSSDPAPLSVYINGKKDKSSISGDGNHSIESGQYGILAGKLRSAVNSQFQGNIDELRMWSTARSQDEIRSNMFEPLDGDETGLIGYWPMDDGNGRQVADLTSNTNHGTQSGEVSFSNNTFPFGTLITGSEGWRLMSSPADNATFEDLLDGLWSQGFTGASTETGTKNVLTWDALSRNWNAPSNITDVPTPGSGFLMYVFDDQDFDDVDDGFPKPVSIPNPRETGEISPDLIYSDDGDGDPSDDGWNLVGNPYDATIDWAASSGWTRTNIESSFYIWNDAADEYQSHNGSAGTLPDALIAPWQGFWVKANAADPEITFTGEIQSAGGTFRKEKTIPLLKFTAEHQSPDSVSALTSSAIIMLSNHAGFKKDALDAYKLQSLNETFLSLFTQSENGPALDINAIPAEFEQPIHIPIQIDGNNVSGTFELSWSHHAFPESWEITLQNHQSGQEIDIFNESTTQFEINTEGKKKISASPVAKKRLLTPRVKKTAAGDSSQFTLTIIPDDVVSNQPEEELPSEIALEQNYPNPFNPSTVISYQLPEESRVDMNVFDMLGRKVAVLTDGKLKKAGTHTVIFNAENLSSGIYIYRLKTGNTVISKKLTVIK